MVIDLLYCTKWDPYYRDQRDAPANPFSPHWVLVLPIVRRSVLNNAGNQYALYREMKNSLINYFTGGFRCII